ncbi:hypothetical protein HDV03_002517 [Kappamyces sp. JEL0829]|nr:hypothetical protein HDV03_002517 [Kappamyces sp. JEL0829]
MKPLLKLDLSTEASRSSAATLELLAQALSQSGCFYAKFPQSHRNHSLFSAARRLFDATVRKQTRREGFLRGFIGLGEESGGSGREEKQGFAYGFQWPDQAKPKNKLQGPNVWPPEYDPAVCADLFDDCSKLNKILVRLLARLYTSDEMSWQQLCQDGDSISIMRLFHYFATEHELLGSSPHTDWGFLTIIKCDESIPGLQLATKDRDGAVQWNDVAAAPPGEADSEDWWIVNGGDFLSLMTKGKSLSPYHRVVSTRSERISFVFFAYPSYDCPTPAHFAPDLSLFTNQSVDAAAMGTRTARIDQSCFGDFINEKWASVGRY